MGFLILISIALIALGLLAGRFLFFKVPVPAGTAKEDYAVSVLVPARNEIHNIGDLIRSLEDQKFIKEIIVADDGSNDGTGERALQLGAKVHIVQKDEWEWKCGKSRGLWQLANQASGDFFLFLDADTRLEPGGLDRIMAEYESRPRGVLSIQPWHKTQTLWEQCAAFVNVLVMAGLNAFTISGAASKPAGAFGPCLLFKRQDYFKCGGHLAVRDYWLEDVPLGQNILKSEIPLHLLGGQGSVWFRMYSEGLREMTQGFAKSFSEGAAAVPASVIILSSLWITGLFNLLGIAVLGGFINPWLRIPLVAGFWFVTSLELYRMFRIAGNFRLSTAVFWPIPFFYFLGIHLLSFLQSRSGKRVWKGRVSGE
jgi:4,4'-diaponeurosporenoate glycosyltransferase